MVDRRYKDNPEYREKTKASARARHEARKNDPEYKAKRSERGKRYYQANKEKILARTRANHALEDNAVAAERVQRWRKAHPEQNASTRMKYYYKNREHILELGKAARMRLWEEAYRFFGPCECCGEHRREFLTIDHRNGGGNEKRRNGEPSGPKLLTKFRQMGWPQDLKKEYRLLCFNCNNSYGHQGYCPHNHEHGTETAFQQTKRLLIALQCPN